MYFTVFTKLCILSVHGLYLLTVCCLEGIKIIGGVLDGEVCDKSYDIFVKKVLSGGLAAADGQYQGPLYHFKILNNEHNCHMQ